MSESVRFAGREVEIRPGVFVYFGIAQDGSGEGAIKAIRPETEDDAHIPESDGTDIVRNVQYRCDGKVVSHMRLSKEAWHQIYAMMGRRVNPSGKLVAVWNADALVEQSQ